MALGSVLAMRKTFSLGTDVFLRVLIPGILFEILALIQYSNASLRSAANPAFLVGLAFAPFVLGTVVHVVYRGLRPAFERLSSRFSLRLSPIDQLGRRLIDHVLEQHASVRDAVNERFRLDHFFQVFRERVQEKDPGTVAMSKAESAFIHAGYQMALVLAATFPLLSALELAYEAAVGEDVITSNFSLPIAWSASLIASSLILLGTIRRDTYVETVEAVFVSVYRDDFEDVVRKVAEAEEDLRFPRGRERQAGTSTEAGDVKGTT